MDTNGIDVLNLKSGTLQLVDDPSQRSGGIGTREDVLVHEETPDEVLVLPSLSQTSVLEEEDTVIVEHVVDLGQEGGEVANTDVLRHLETGNLLVAALGDGNVTVVHAQNLALLLGDANLAHGAVAPGGLVAAESDTGSAGAIVLAGEAGEGAPAAANIKQAVALLQTNLLADDGHLVVLELLEGLLPGDVGNDTRGVDHARAKEPAVEVITSVVVVTDLLLIYELVLAPCEMPKRGRMGYVSRLTLRASVHNDLGNHAKEEELDQADSEAEAGPVVAVLHGLEAVALKVDLAVEVHLVERLHGDAAVATVLDTVGLILELQVVLDGTAGQTDLLGLAGADGRDGQPPGGEQRKVDDDGEEDGGLEATAHLAAQEPGDKDEDADEDVVVEGVGTRAIGGEGRILDGRILRERKPLVSQSYCEGIESFRGRRKRAIETPPYVS